MRVLIAHASETSRRSLADVVTRGRWLSLDILTAADGPETLELLLGDDPPEVALLDWDLPGIEAPEMCRLVRDFQHRRHTWVIVLAPAAHRESVGEVWKAGADDCVFTPAPQRLLSGRVTKGLCEMAPPILEAAEHEAARRQTQDAARPSLDAVRGREDEVCSGEPAGVAAALHAVVDPAAPDDPAGPAATPVELAAQVIDLDEGDDAPRDRVTLEAVVVHG